MKGNIKLQGRIFISFAIQAVTGLHIGGSSVGLEIGGLDNPVIRDPLTRKPYIPGSSLRGKIRSQLEKHLGLQQNKHIGKDVSIHMCQDDKSYNAQDISKGGCPVCHLFGVAADLDKMTEMLPTLMVVRDVMLSEQSVNELNDAKTDFQFTQLKTEVAIDRVTSHATPRTLERVPAGAIFRPAEMVMNLYRAEDQEFLPVILEGLQLVEDDALGGYGSRGSGKVKFSDLHFSARASADYSLEVHFQAKEKSFTSLAEVHDSEKELTNWLKQTIRAG